MGLLKTQEASRVLHISDSTLRYYEKYGLIKPKRGVNNYRLFDENLLLQIKYISLMKYAGFSLDHIKLFMKLYHEPMSLACNKSTQNLIRSQRERLLKKIEDYQKIVRLLNKIIRSTDMSVNEDLNKREIDHAIDRLFSQIKIRGDLRE